MTNSNKWTIDKIPNLAGKIAIVTGANSGLGFETSRALARSNAHVIMTSRNQQKGQKALNAIQQEAPDSSLQLTQLDLADLTSVASFADDYLSQHNQLHILVNNAGVMAIPQRATSDGFEMQFGTNHLGHFALTGQLLPALLNTPGARVVNVSSTAHRFGKINFDDLNWEQSYNRWQAYGASKAANLFFTYELQRKFEERGADVISVAAHPGYASTNLQGAGAKMNGSDFQMRVTNLMNKIFAQSQEMGALPQLYAATASEVQGGEYFGPDSLFESRGHPQKVESNEYSHDTAVAQKLWQVSEELTGVTYSMQAKSLA